MYKEYSLTGGFQSDCESTVAKNVVNFCAFLPKHLEKFQVIKQSMMKTIEVMGNYAEQLRHVENTNLKKMDDFQSVKENLSFCILKGIEEEIKGTKTFL